MRLVFRFLILAVVVHFGIAAGTPYVMHRFLDMRVDEIAKSSTDRSERWVRDQILEYAREKRIPLEPEDMQVWRSRNDIRIWIEYDQTVRVPFYRYDATYRVVYPEGTEPLRRFAGRS